MVNWLNKKRKWILCEVNYFQCQEMLANNFIRFIIFHYYLKKCTWSSERSFERNLQKINHN